MGCAGSSLVFKMQGNLQHIQVSLDICYTTKGDFEVQIFVKDLR